MEINNIVIEPFSIKYLEQVGEIHYRVADGWSLKGLVADLANSATKSYVATIDGKAVAFCSYLVTDDAELEFVCVHPSYRHKGIATKLLGETMAQMPREIYRVVLEVRSQNENAIKLYEKLGFDKLGIRKRFYSSPADDAVVMEKNRNGAKELD